MINDFNFRYMRDQPIVVMFCIGCVHFLIQYCVSKYVQGHRDLQIALPAEGKSDSLYDTQAI